MNVLLVSTYELGRQPFGLASPSAWLQKSGVSVSCLDLSRQRLRDHEDVVRSANLIAFYLPMHTATQIALRVAPKLRSLNSTAHLCAYGLYAPITSSHLQEVGFETILGGEFEGTLTRCVDRVRGKADGGRLELAPGPVISLDKQRFVVPDRSGLPLLSEYARLVSADGSSRTVGYTEATRGCKHRCRHCPIVPVYNGAFRVVQRDVVMADVRQQVAMGAEHVTFGDPDFFNGVGHALALVDELHHEFPSVTYDVTIKVEHLLKHKQHLSQLRDTGCVFITSAVESLDERVLTYLDKGHSRADFIEVVRVLQRIGLGLNPTFVAFTPWTTLEGYAQLLATLAELDLIESTAPIQLAIRLLIPPGSRLLELTNVQEIVGPFESRSLSYPWVHSDPRVDALQRELESVVAETAEAERDRRDIFMEAWSRVQTAMDRSSRLPVASPLASRVTIPYLTEPWYC